MLDIELQNIAILSKDAIANNEGGDAKELLRKLEALISTQNLSKTDPELFQKLQILKKRLRIVAFPFLVESEALDVIRTGYLTSYEIDISMENQITVALFMEPYLVRDDLRNKLQKALLDNSEKLGNFTIGQWLQEFGKMFDVRTRSKADITSFVLRHPQAKLLEPSDRSKIKDLLLMHDSLLISTLPATEPTLSKMLATMPSANPARSKQKGYNPTSATQSAAELITLALNDALKQFPETGERIITSESIKILRFPEPVRPSIKNWLSDYTSTLDRERRDSITRSKYLFQEKNTRDLNSEDRQRLAFILKAFDENGLVTVDKANKRIVFPDVNQDSKPKDRIISNQNQISNLQTTNGSQIQKNPVKTQTAEPAQSPSRLNPESSTPGQTPANKFSFSFPQQLPYEKIATPTQPAPSPNANSIHNNNPRPAQPTTKPVVNQPYRITPTSSRQQIVDTRQQVSEPKPAPQTPTRVIGKNVVNLRD